MSDKRKPTYAAFRKAIKLDDEIKFKSLAYYDKKTGEIIDAEKDKFKNELIGYHALRKSTERLSKTHWHNLSQDKDLLNQIAKIFSCDKDEQIMREKLEKLTFTSLTSDEKTRLIAVFLKDVSFNSFNNLSIKAIEKLLPYMYKGMRYDEAVKEVYPDKKTGEKSRLLRALNEQENNVLTNPVVKRAISQIRKVINAIIREYGTLDSIHIELARELKKSVKDRREIEKKQGDYQKYKQEKVKQFIECFGEEPKGQELQKFTLAEEQGWCCIYSREKINPERLREIGYVEIDHILPYSRSLDDTKINKALCLSKENQQKGNKTPYEYFKEIGRDWGEYEVWLGSLKSLKYNTRKRLLKRNFDENSEKEFKNSNLNDVATIAILIKDFIEDTLIFNDNGSKRHVEAVNGSITAFLRHQWGLEGKNRQNHLHHAEDATIIAFATQSVSQKLATIAARNDKFNFESKEEKTKKIKFPPPFEDFRAAIEASVSDIFVSIAPRKKVTGAAHKKTVYSKRENKGFFEINGGLAELGEVKRIDVFQNNGRIHFVYLYAFDFLKNELPNKTIKGIEITNDFQFMFSIFKDEYIGIKPKDREAIYGYFKFGLGDGRFVVIDHRTAEYNKDDFCISTGSLEWIRKFHVDILGNIHEVKQEKRIGTKRSK